MGLLSLVTFLPLIGGIILLALPEGNKPLLRGFSLTVSILTFVLSLSILTRFDSSSFHFQLMENLPWIPSLGIHYQMGVDGISIWMVILTTFLSIISISLSAYETKRLKTYLCFLLLLETSLIGTFLALDMILFYSFFELMLLPMVFLIWIWGDEGKKKAALRFFVYLFGGSILMLVGIVVLAHQNQLATGSWSFSLLDVQASAAKGTLWSGTSLQFESAIFWFFALAFLVKSPSFPFHTWLVDSYTQAPVGAVLLGALVKTGAYGLVRFCLPLFPDVLASATPIILTLAVIGILYGASLAAVQVDVKRVIAYSSVSHVGFIILGIFSMDQTGLVGGVLGGFYHGIASGLLITLIALICMRRGSRKVTDFGGLKVQMPIFAALFLIATLAAVGLPGTNDFISEFFSLIGAFEAGNAHFGGVNVYLVALATSGVILAAVYMLILFQKMFYGKNDKPEIMRLKDLKPWEVAIGVSFVILIFIGGVAPSLFTSKIESSVEATRMMSENGIGRRPIWEDLNQSFNSSGDLIENLGGTPIDLSRPKYHPASAIALAPASANEGGN